ncbi:hypothetical protein J7382_12945 [Shimia sp. R11_0]|uniref:hypothetical protein n=1 Tax=Shimia sp. R11_0 TaxID=2821096 RepID=UPI001AD9A380|nr:hypothetical protein [Shimia sp. R11_0]MBO9478447.1 hypothetical protein [Shimia sp. R11_0]
MDLPEPRDFGWDLKGHEGAFSTVTHLSDGRTLFEVEHSPVQGVTAEMLHWWYGVYADLTLVIDGERYPAFLVAHPTEHVSLTSEKHDAGAPLAPGDHVTLVEVYGGDLRRLVNQRFEVTHLDASRYALQVKVKGVVIADVEFRYRDGDNGAAVRNTFTLGLRRGLWKPFVNRLLLPWVYHEDKTYAWVQHNIEEIGNLENFLPEIYARRDQGMTIYWNRNQPPDRDPHYVAT